MFVDYIINHSYFETKCQSIYVPFCLVIPSNINGIILSTRQKIAFIQDVNDVCMHTYYVYLILIVQLTQEL